MKKYLLPPVAPLILLYALCLFVAIDDYISPVLMVDGHPDNAPHRAAMLIPFLTPVFYAFWVAINTIDSLMERAMPRFPWLSTIIITTGLGALEFSMLFTNGSPPQHITLLAMEAMAIAGVQVIPMSFWRRRIKSKGRTIGCSLRRTTCAVPEP